MTAKSWKQARYSSIDKWINCDTSTHKILFSNKQKQAIKPCKETYTEETYMSIANGKMPI